MYGNGHAAVPVARRGMTHGSRCLWVHTRGRLRERRSTNVAATRGVTAGWHACARNSADVHHGVVGPIPNSRSPPMAALMAMCNQWDRTHGNNTGHNNGSEYDGGSIPYYPHRSATPIERSTTMRQRSTTNVQSPVTTIPMVHHHEANAREHNPEIHNHHV